MNSINPEIEKLARLEAARLVRQWQRDKVDSAAGVRALLRAGIERVALAAVAAGVEHVGAHHRHLLRIVDVAGEPNIEVSEPGKAGCTCVVRRPLSEVAHLLLNITDAEWWPISSRDRDAAGHQHDAIGCTNPECPVGCPESHAAQLPDGPNCDTFSGHVPKGPLLCSVMGLDAAGKQRHCGACNSTLQRTGARDCDAADPLHPDGACTCGGEGRCSWCHYGEPGPAALKATEEPGPAAFDPPVIELAHPGDCPEGYRFSTEGGLALAVSPDRGCARCGESGMMAVGTKHVIGCPCVKRRAVEYVKAKAGGAA